MPVRLGAALVAEFVGSFALTFVGILAIHMQAASPGGTGLISGRKAFQRPMQEGIALLNAIQDVYLTKEVTIA